jgi:hypothetical protein
LEGPAATLYQELVELGRCCQPHDVSGLVDADAVAQVPSLMEEAGVAGHSCDAVAIELVEEYGGLGIGCCCVPQHQ